MILSRIANSLRRQDWFALFIELLNELSGDRQAKVPALVCAECGRKMRRRRARAAGAGNAADDGKTCLMACGMICLGFITRGGCRAACSANGLPCWGCRGLSSGALKKVRSGESVQELLLRRLLRITSLTRETAIRSIRAFTRHRHSLLNFSADLAVRGGQTL